MFLFYDHKVEKLEVKTLRVGDHLYRRNFMCVELWIGLDSGSSFWKFADEECCNEQLFIGFLYAPSQRERFEAALQILRVEK